MHTTKKHTLVRRALLWGVALLIPFFSVSCSHELVPDVNPDDATVVLTIKTPGNPTVTRSTRARQTEDETRISDVKVLVFSDPARSGAYAFSYMVNGTQLDYQDDQSTRFLALLRTSTVPLKLYVVANGSSAFSGYAPTQGVDESTVKTALQQTFATPGMTAHLPMFGEVALGSLDAGTTNIMNVKVLRSVARVDVKKKLLPESDAFSLREVYIYRGNDRIQVIPNAMVLNEIKVSAPSVPSGANALAAAISKTSVGDTDSIGGIYIPEANSFESSNDKRTKATTVIVGGVYANDDDISYYRVDFDSKVAGHPFGQVLRNYLYTFSICKVSASGWPTPDEAAVNLSSSMTVEVTQWEDFITDVYLDDYYLAVSKRTLRMPYLGEYTRRITVRASDDYSFQWLDAGGNPIGTPTTNTGTPVDNGDGRITVTKKQGDDDVTYLDFYTNDYNYTDDERPYRIRLKSNRITLDIDVIKETPKNYSDRYFTVASAGSYLNLGNISTIVGTARPMRHVLDYQFTPNSSYPFKIGGFSYWQFPTFDAGSHFNATTPQRVAELKRMLENVDILAMGYITVMSPQVGKMLWEEWLVEKPHRVIMAGRDEITTNDGLYAQVEAAGEGSWKAAGNSFTAANRFRRAVDADYAYNNAAEVYEFFNGPFGTVSGDLGLRGADAVSCSAQISQESKQRVTPLVYSNTPNYNDYLFVGANKEKGIAYIGDGEFLSYSDAGNTYGGMSLSAYNTGTLNTGTDNLNRQYWDVLNANIWAWAVGRIIYGPRANVE